MNELMEELIKSGTLPAGDFGFAIYSKFDPVKGVCEYTTGFGYQDEPDIDDTIGLESGKLEDHHALHISHTGTYRHLGNAWATAMGYQRHLKKKPSKTVHTHEIYSNDPGKVEEKDLVTDIFIPIR